MKTFAIDIYTQIWDDEGFGPIEDRHLKTVSYSLQTTVKEFSKEIQYLLANELGDGYSFTIYEFEDIVFVRIEVFFREEYDFILDYLEEAGAETGYPVLNQQSTPKMIQLPVIQRETREDLINELEKKFGNNIVISDSEMIYEKGFSNWEANLLVWLNNLQIAVVANFISHYLYNKLPFNKPRINLIHEYDDDKILQTASDKTGVNKKDLKIIEIKLNEEDRSMFYYITSLYVDVSMQISKDKEIISFKADPKTHSRI